VIGVPRARAVAIVDDNAADRMILEEVWKRTGLPNPVTAFEDGTKFLAFMDRAASAEAETPALVLLDVNMPRMSGFDVVRALRARDPFAELPVVVLISSSDAREDAARAIEAGAAAFLAKQTGVREFVALFSRTFESID